MRWLKLLKTLENPKEVQTQFSALFEKSNITKDMVLAFFYVEVDVFGVVGFFLFFYLLGPGILVEWLVIEHVVGDLIHGDFLLINKQLKNIY